VILEVEGLEAGYGGAKVLHGLDLHVGDGEGVVVLGPNGHGKTTLLRALSGLLRSSAGTIRFHGIDVTRWRADQIAKAGLVHIPQGDLVFHEMNVRENLLLGSYVRTAWKQRKERLERVYDLFPMLGDRRRQQASSLSGGERRMLAIGRGLMGDAKLLMIDEPSLGLAPVIIEDIYARIQSIKDEGLPVLLADENAEHAGALADRVLLLETGVFVREGPAASLLNDEALLSTYLG
jgi:branched-chain amino acid transport system ATP-binding protein